MMYVIAALLGLLSVAFGAFGAHALKQVLTPKLLDTFEVAVRYQFIHVFAMFVSAWFFQVYDKLSFKWSWVLFLIGIILFSGSLYSYVLTGSRALVFITPVGGVCLMVGWALMAFGFIVSRKRAEDE